MSRPGFFGAPRKGAYRHAPPLTQARRLSSEPTVRAHSEQLTAVNSEYRERRKDAIKRVIANMTVGKDVSALFPDVLKNMQTEDIEQKKLVYLYLMNYAKTQPELVILAVNTFVKVRRTHAPLTPGRRGP